MKNWIISLVVMLFKKETTHWIGGLIITSFFCVLNWIGTLPDVPFLLGLTLSFILGIILLFAQKLFLLGKIFIIFGIFLMLVVIIKNNVQEAKIGTNEISMSCDDLVHKLCHADSISWKLYQERNPEILAWVGCAMLEECEKEEDMTYKIPLIKYADSLLNEARKADVAYAYFGRAYKEFYGLGCDKSVKEAVRDVQICLNMKYCGPAYCLLEQMNLDSTEYPDVVRRIRVWRDSVDNVNVSRYQDLCDTFFPSYDNLRWFDMSVTAYYTDLGAFIAIEGNTPKHDSVIKEMHSLYNSVYRGDTTSYAWKVLERNVDFIKDFGGKVLDGEFNCLLAAYYWGKGDVNLARLYSDSLGFYGIWNQYYDFNKFSFNSKESLAQDITREIDDVLHYSSMEKLEYYRSCVDNQLLRHVLDAALKRRYHHIRKEDKQWKKTEDSLTLKTNYFIKQLRPHVSIGRKDYK